MKSVSIILPTLGSGGAEKQAALLAKYLSNYYRVNLFIMFGEHPIVESNKALVLGNDNIALHQFKGNTIIKLREFYNTIKEIPDDVCFNYLTFCDIFCSLLERIAGKKYVYNGIRNSRLPLAKRIGEFFSHNWLVTASIFNCFSGASFFRTKGFKSSKCLVIPNCFPDIASPIERKQKDVVKIITVGRFVEQKDYETAIKTISLTKGKRIEFIIVGYGTLEQSIRYWITKYGIEKITTIYINPTNTQELLKESDIYLSTSLFEGTSNSIMEALNWSLPVVATNVGDNDQLVKNGVSGYLHAVKDASGLAGSLDLLVENHALRNSMGAEGNAILRNSYSVDSFVKQYRELIEQ